MILSLYASFPDFTHYNIKGPIIWRISAQAEISATLSCNYMTRQDEISHVIDFKFQPRLENCLPSKKKEKKNKNEIQMAEKKSVTTHRRKLSKNLKPRFIWDKEERINRLIQCVLSYKPETQFDGKDFNADKVS